MSNLIVTWDLPIKRADGRALPIEEILHTRVEMKVDGAPEFTPLDPVLPSEEQEHFFEDIDPGTYHFQAFTVDTLEQDSLPATGSISIDPALPGSPQNFKLTLE